MVSEAVDMTSIEAHTVGSIEQVYRCELIITATRLSYPALKAPQLMGPIRWGSLASQTK